MSDEVTGQTDPAADIERLTRELEECKQQSEEHLNGWKRAKADYINFKNDQDKRQKELAQFASMTSLLSYVPIVDNFRTAFANLPKDLESSEWVRGVQQIYIQMKEMLKTMGVEEFSGLVGKPFNPSEHQAVGQEQRDDFEDDIISQEVSAGYMLHSKVLVPAKVIVNKKTSNL
ncbi:nucleotide exchange factor GrpE [Candidatus Uhrbacteria bacterium]|nr:nucleotide exchange factor GrpE [Candidatus Uhrbacteria bacterium]